ncbi:MAG: excinuclease ABC subunit B [Parcubacteria group bacterium Gr01-1014_38]|nr:MAG: excinuclease ABC subunit B [Parcubacteria group bacterium Gr01-1014_38]
MHIPSLGAARYAERLTMPTFRVHAPFTPAGDQPKAIAELVASFRQGANPQTLLGVTGSGKTNVAAWVIEQLQQPTLVLSHNKTLAAQLAQEFKELFPENAVQYFVSYYDYYQPEAYVPRTDTYIQKDADINDEIDRLRHAATQALLERDDVLVVASVSAIYGLGSPTDYVGQKVKLAVGNRQQAGGSRRTRSDILRELTYALYARNDIDFKRGTFRVRGDTVDVHPVGDETIVRLKFFGDELEAMERRDPLTGNILTRYDTIEIYPAKLYITPADRMRAALQNIRLELEERVKELKERERLVEAQRLEERTNYDLEMLETAGTVPGIENYSRHMDGRQSGQPPVTLLDVFAQRFGKNFLCVIDESHVTLPQISGMHAGDRSRKETLVAHGFRLPSALDNRPLRYDEFEARLGSVLYASATPNLEERQKSKKIVELIVRPTGLLDPTIEIRPTEGQIDHLLDVIQERIKRNERVLVTTLTKRMAEDLAEYLGDLGIKVAYIHADVDTLDRIDLLQDLRAGKIDVLVGINLLREGLDLPEVSLVAILDADKEGYLRSDTALIQVMGRAARHVRGHVIMYADRVTGSMQRAMNESERRRHVQETFNREHGVTPQSIQKRLRTYEFRLKAEERATVAAVKLHVLPEDIPHVLQEITAKMHLAAQNLEFEEAARLRDQLSLLKGEVKSQKPRRRRK